MALISTILAFFFAKYDANILKSGAFIYSHNSRFIIRFVSVFLASLILRSFYGIYSMDLLTVKSVALTFLGGGLIFASLFDLFLNMILGLPLFHLGNTAKWDKFWRKRYPLYIVAKILAYVLGFVIILLSFV